MPADCVARRTEIFVLVVIAECWRPLSQGVGSPTEPPAAWPAFWVNLAPQLLSRASLTFMQHPPVLLLALADAVDVPKPFGREAAECGRAERTNA